MRHSLDAIWGAVLDAVEFDIIAQSLAITCHVTAGSHVDHHRLKFKELSELRFFNAIPGPWKYAELTEIHVNRTASGATQVEIVFWSEDSCLVAGARSVELDGEPVTVTLKAFPLAGAGDRRADLAQHSPGWRRSRHRRRRARRPDGWRSRADELKAG
jgi:hypothetical protein